MNLVNIEDKLAVNKYDIDNDVHIKVNEDICAKCENHHCLHVCPADCFKLMDGKITFNYRGCLECGSCRIACDKGAIDWTVPRGGFGICYAYG